MKPWFNILVLPLCLVGGCGNEADGSATSGGGMTVASVPADDLRAAAADSPARTFYEQRGWKAAWSEDAGNALRSALDERRAHGLDRVRFLDSGGGSPAAREVALTRAALAYASALSRGLTDPGELYDTYTIPRSEPNLLQGLGGALEGGSVREWLLGLAPQGADYRAISQAYQRLAGSDEKDAPSIFGGDLIHPGDEDPRVPQIAAALARAGYIDKTGGSSPGHVYTDRLSEAVLQLQEDRGIKADRIVGSQVIEALNTGAQDQARAAAVALERRRWLQRDPPATRVDVNTAAAVLTYFRDGSAVDQRETIVGRPGWKTPQLQSPMYRLVANPTWTVPKSIEEEELSGVSASYLRSRNMVRRDGWIVQLPGPENALGLVKFDLQNQYAIYLHDTASKSLFDRNQRQLSHGCVRVQGALDFASTLAQHQGVTSKWQEARATGEETFVPLPDTIPVRLIYHPTLVSNSGKVVFLQDIYGWNGPIAERLGFDAKATKTIEPDVEDFGP